MTESNETKAPNYYRVLLLIDVDEDTYDSQREWGKTPEQIKQGVKKGLHIGLPAPCYDYEVLSIEEVFGCGIGKALCAYKESPLIHRIMKIKEHEV